MRTSALCISLAFCGHALLARADLPDDPTKNCALVQPPESATRTPILVQPPENAPRTLAQGNEAITFPVRPGPTYSGCLWLWIATGGTIRVEDVIRFRNGHVLSFRRTIRFAEPYSTECAYDGSKVVARTTNPPSYAGDDCPEPSNLQIMLTGKPEKR